jgi:hypothetical protein
MSKCLEIRKEIADFGQLVFFYVKLKKPWQASKFNWKTSKFVSLCVKYFKVAEVLNGMR